MSDTIIEINGITKYFGDKPVVYDLSFSIKKGEIFALLGPNGAGKSTLIKMLLGMIEPTRGSATLFNCDCQFLTPAVRSKIGYLSEGHHLYPWMRIKDIEAFKKAHPYWVQKKFDYFVQYFQIERKQKIQFLSNGQKAQLSLSLALACEPELLIMDDPTLGLDTGIRREFLKGILELVSLEERTVLFSSHIMSDVERVADRVGIIEKGMLRTDISLEEFKSSVKQYHVHFDVQIPASLIVPRMINYHVSGKDVMFTVTRSDNETEEAFRKMGASSWKQVELSFEDAFVEYTAHQKQQLSFTTTT